MADRRSPPLLAIVALVTIIAVVAWAFSQTVGRPRWQLSATNTSAGLEVEVFREGDSSPIYSTLLPNHRVQRNIERVTIDTLPGDIGQTTFSDETLKSGRWTVVIDGVELDVTPRALIIDGGMELSPATKVD